MTVGHDEQVVLQLKGGHETLHHLDGPATHLLEGVPSAAFHNWSSIIEPQRKVETENILFYSGAVGQGHVRVHTRKVSSVCHAV